VFIRFIEQKEHPWLTIFFNWFPSILLAYLIPAGISVVIQKDFSGADIHNLSKALFIPLAIVAVMSSLSLTQLKSIGWKPILVSFRIVLDCCFSHWLASPFQKQCFCTRFFNHPRILERYPSGGGKLDWR